MTSEPLADNFAADLTPSCFDLFDDDQLRALMRHIDPRSADPAEVRVARYLLEEAVARKLGPAALRARVIWRA